MSAHVFVRFIYWRLSLVYYSSSSLLAYFFSSLLCTLHTMCFSKEPLLRGAKVEACFTPEPIVPPPQIINTVEKEAQVAKSDDSLCISGRKLYKSCTDLLPEHCSSPAPIIRPSFASNYPVQSLEFICIACLHKIITLPNNFPSCHPTQG